MGPLDHDRKSAVLTVRLDEIIIAASTTMPLIIVMDGASYRQSVAISANE
jgi:hypothetical protein